MARVELVELSKKYEECLAVSGINLEVEDEEFVVLLGPSGCGKSTTLRMIAGLEEPTGGEIYINERLVNYVAPKDRDVAMVFQNYALYPHMSVFDNMSFSLKRAKWPKEKIQRRVEEVARSLRIQELMDRYPEQLSGGQRQRVALGRAIVRDPAVFLMDEPLSNLDAILRVQMREELLKLHHRLKTTTIYVTHDQVEAMTLGRRIVVLLDGAIQQVGSPLQVYDHPVNTFVAAFIGSPSMNLFLGELVRENESWHFRTPSWDLRLPAQAGRRVDRVKGRLLNPRVRLGIRPEDLELLPGDRAASLRGEVSLLEPVGANMYVRVTCGDVECLVCTDPRVALAIGQSVSVGLDWDRIHVFDEEGANLFASEE
jgi:multiple sugar transport system ATP-binding protein